MTDGNWETTFYLFQKNWLDSGAPSQQAMRMWLFTSGQNMSLRRGKGVGVWALGLQCGQRTSTAQGWAAVGKRREGDSLTLLLENQGSGAPLTVQTSSWTSLR